MANAEHSQKEPATPPRRIFWRRLVQYRLRTLLILTTIIAVGLGWWSFKARQQREAVAALSDIATFRYDFQDQGLNRPAYLPAWLVDVLGVDCFGNVEAANFAGEMNFSSWERVAPPSSTKSASATPRSISSGDWPR